MAKIIPHPHPHPTIDSHAAPECCERWETQKAQARQGLSQLRAREAQFIGQRVQIESDLQDVRAQIVAVFAAEQAGDQALAWLRAQQTEAAQGDPPAQE